MLWGLSLVCGEVEANAIMRWIRKDIMVTTGHGRRHPPHPRSSREIEIECWRLTLCILVMTCIEIRREALTTIWCQDQIRCQEVCKTILLSSKDIKGTKGLTTKIQKDITNDANSVNDTENLKSTNCTKETNVIGLSTLLKGISRLCLEFIDTSESCGIDPCPGSLDQIEHCFRDVMFRLQLDTNTFGQGSSIVSTYEI
eukprot:g113.t1